MTTRSTTVNGYGLRTPAGWWECTLKDVCNGNGGVIQTGPFGSQLHAHDYKETGTPVVMPQQLGDNQISVEGIARISDEDVQRLKRHCLRRGDIVFSRRGDVTRRAFITEREKGWLCGTGCMLIRPHHPKLCNEYLAFFFSLHEVKEYITKQAVGATMPNLNTGILEAIPLFLPSLTYQQKAVAVLTAYDDLIENNTRRIVILEEMAQAIYREWFVNFRFPGHDKVKLINSPLGKIPEGWKTQPIGSTLEFHIGGGWGQDNVDEEFSNPAFVIRGTDIPDARSLRVVDCPLRYHTDSNIRTRKLCPNDLVFEVSGGSKGQPVGRCLFVSERLLKRFDGDVICASFCKVIRANPAILAPEILYHYLVESYTNGTIEQYEVQSTGIKNFKFTVFLESESLAVPPAKTQQAFLGHVRPILDAVHAIGKKNEVLRNTRDLLLPKLISGQLDVEDLDIDTGEPLVEAP